MTTQVTAPVIEELDSLLNRLGTDPLTVVGAAAAGLVTALLIARIGLVAGRAMVRRLASSDPANLLTYVAAALASVVAAQGMWRVFGDVLHFPPVLRLLTFGFIEVAVVTSAVRARRAVRDQQDPGVDGMAVWALTSLSAVLSALDARSFPETVFRLAAPLVAAWLWERGMAVERRRTGRGRRIHWRITPERIAVRLHLAEPTDRTAGDVDAERHLVRLALAAKHARDLRDSAALPRRRHRARARLETALERAVTHTDLATNPNRQQHLLAHLGALYHSEALLDARAAPPWSPTKSPAESAVTVTVADTPARAPEHEGHGPQEPATDELATERRNGQRPGILLNGHHQAQPTAAPAQGNAGERSLAERSLAERPEGERPPAERPEGESPASGRRISGRSDHERSARRSLVRGGVRHGGAAVDCPIPHVQAWDWFQEQRAAGRDPQAPEWQRVWGLPPSTARRYRKASVQALEETDH